MKRRQAIDYTFAAQRSVYRFPMLTYIGVYINFWIIGNLILVTIIHLMSKIFSQSLDIAITGRFGALALMGIVIGFLYGFCLGLSSYYLDKTVFKRWSQGKVIIIKAAGSLFLLSLMLWLIKEVLFVKVLAPSFSLPVAIDEQSWKYLFILLVIYYFLLSVLLSFITQINNKYGPGVLIPLLFGRYKTPQEEDRIFMFMDLKLSTTIAESLGHLKYSAFIRDCFEDINDVLFPYYAQVYQYVGDEIVLTWPTNEGIKEHHCIRFFFASQKHFQDRADYYKTNYGVVPEFKAGLHSGIVSAVEIGKIKKDIAYHGDTLNTAARIQSICNEYGKSLLVSSYLFEKIGPHPNMTTETIGKVLLKGKSAATEIISIESFKL
jgi:adenylate cyclase